MCYLETKVYITIPNPNVYIMSIGNTISIRLPFSSNQKGPNQVLLINPHVATLKGMHSGIRDDHLKRKPKPDWLSQPHYPLSLEGTGCFFLCGIYIYHLANLMVRQMWYCYVSI